MPQIKTNKKYDFLVTFGCSFTSGHVLGDDGAWGHFLAKRLNCKHINQGGGACNPNISTSVINFCEHNDMSNACVGIQWSEATRRELWQEFRQQYWTIGLGTLMDKDLWEKESSKTFLQPIRDNLDFFSGVYFDLRENILRSVLAMIHVKSYLTAKNIDFIQFEGINSILDIEGHDTSSPAGPCTLLKLTNSKIKNDLLNDKTFFSELGNLNTWMRNIPNWDSSLNDGHPYPEILNLYVDHMYEHIKRFENID